MEPAGQTPPPSSPSPEHKSPSQPKSPKESQIAKEALQISNPTNFNPVSLSNPTNFNPVSLTEEQKEGIRKHQEAKAAAPKPLDEDDFFLLEETSQGVFQAWFRNDQN